MPKYQLSMKGQIGLSLGIVCFFCMAVSIAGYMGSQQSDAKIAAFASEGETVTGTITKKYIHSVTRSQIWVYWLDVRFKSDDGAVRNESTSVPNSIFDKLELGGQVPVTYVRSNPDWFYVAGEAPTERDVTMGKTMMEIGIFAGLFSLVGLLGLFLWRDGDGTPADRTSMFTSAAPRTEPTFSGSAVASATPATGQTLGGNVPARRGSFGTRKR